MRALIPWYRRWRIMIGEAWRFGVVGAANVLINFVVFNALALTLFPSGELKANVVATVFATTTSYLMNRGWTFRHRRTTRIPREYVLFLLFNAAGLAIELAVMGAAKYGLGLTTLWALNLAKLTGLGLGTVFRFWTYRSFVFAGAPAGTGDAPAPAATASGTPAPATAAPDTAAAPAAPDAAAPDSPAPPPAPAPALAAPALAEAAPDSAAPAAAPAPRGGPAPLAAGRALAAPAEVLASPPR